MLLPVPWHGGSQPFWAQNATAGCLHPEEAESLLINNWKNWGCREYLSGLRLAKIIGTQSWKLGDGHVQAPSLCPSPLPRSQTSVSVPTGQGRHTPLTIHEASAPAPPASTPLCVLFPQPGRALPPICLARGNVAR